MGWLIQPGQFYLKSGHCPEYSEIFPTTRFDSGHLILGQTQMEAGQVMGGSHGGATTGVSS